MGHNMCRLDRTRRERTREGVRRGGGGVRTTELRKWEEWNGEVEENPLIPETLTKMKPTDPETLKG